MKKLLFVLLLSSCIKPEPKCVNPKKGKAIFVAFRVAKSSHFWFKNIETNTIYNIANLGGIREPNINLGDTIDIEYCDAGIIFDKFQYVMFASNKETRFRSLYGYEYLCP